MALLPLLAGTQQRAAAALLGAIIGDTASQTSHWNYDRRTLFGLGHSRHHRSTKLRNDDRYDNPEFYPCDGFYTVLPGGNLCYGDELIAVAEHLVRCRGVDGEDDPLGPADTRKLIDGLESTFGGASAYGPWPAGPDAPRPRMPIDGPWRHGSIKGFLANFAAGKRDVPDCGSDDSRVDCLLLRGHARRVHVCRSSRPVGSRVEVAVRSTQNTDEAVAYARLAARMLEACILGRATDAVAAIEMAVASEKREAAAAEGGRGEGGREYPRPRAGPRARRGDYRDGAALLPDGRGLPRDAPSADETQPQESGEFGGLIDAPGAVAAAAVPGSIEPRRRHRSVRLLRAARTRIDTARGVLGESVDAGGCRERCARSARRRRSGLARGLAGSAGGAGPDEGAGNRGRGALRCAVERKSVAAMARKHTRVLVMTGADGRVLTQ